MSGYRKSSREEKNSKFKSHPCRERPTRYEGEAKTPPLLTRRPSIDNLMKQRESLRKELEKISKHSDSDCRHKTMSRYKNSQHSKPGPCPESLKRRRHSNNTMHSDMQFKKTDTIEKIPETSYGDHVNADSEDEETIIQQRRQKRKLLLEKLNVRFEEGHEAPSKLKKIKQDDDTKIQEKLPVMKTKASVKEIPDMFSEQDEFKPSDKCDLVTQDNAAINSSQLTDNWDDPDGYYNIKVGDELNNNSYVIKSLLGQGVFANVVRAVNKANNTEVAIKIVRNNDLMFKTSMKEVTILKKIAEEDPENKYHCIRYIKNFIHKNHLCIVLESMHMDLRCILKKYGKHGLNMKALVSYSRQLLVALRLLKKIGIVHADVKPDNILVNEKKNVLKLCDFGSAGSAEDHEATPYMVSRFYRAPEVILGIDYKHSIDIWSAACTIFEMATGKIMFAGSSNNKMLKSFMDMKGKIPVRLIRKGRFKDQHFNYNNNFIMHKKDEFTGREKYIEMVNITLSRDLGKELKTYCKCSNSHEEKKLEQLKQMLDKMLSFDTQHRPSATDCLRHPFVQEQLKK